MAAWERRFWMSVCHTTRSAPRSSKARVSRISFDSVLTRVRQYGRATQVCPMASVRNAGSIS